MAVEHQSLAVERAGVDHPGGDLAPDAGQRLEPGHRRSCVERLEMRQIDRAALRHHRLQGALQPLGGDIGIGLRRQQFAQFVERCLGDRLPATVAREQPVSRGVGDRRFGPRADQPLHQHPFGPPPLRRGALDPPESLDQQRLEPPQGLGARIGAERELHLSRCRHPLSSATLRRPLYSHSIVPGGLLV